MAAPQQPGYGQFTGYEPLPNGGYNFKLATGASVPFAGAPAEELRKQIDAAKGAPMAAPAYTPGAGPMPAPAQSPAAEAQPLPMGSTKGGGVAMLRPGGNPQNPADWFERMPARAPSKGGMQARGMTSQGGYTVDERFLEQMEGSQMRSAAIQEQSLQRGMAAAAEREGYMKAQQAQAERDMAVQAHENAVKQQRMGEFQAKYDKAEQDYTNFHAEKEAEANSPKAKLASFLGTLSSALGALGASMARTPNFAMEAVQRHNEMQLRREEAELRVRKDAKDSLLGRLQQEMGSLDLAKTAYRAMQAKQATLGWETLAQKEQNQEKQQQLLQVAELQNRDYLKWREQYVRGSEGEVTRTFQYVPGSSGSRGGDRPLSLDDAAKIANIGQTYASTNKTNADATATATKELKPVAPERTTQISEDAALLATGDRILNNPSIKGIKSDVFEGRGSIRSKVPLIGDAIAPESYKEYEQDLQSYANSRIKAITGAGMAEAEAQRIMRAELGEGRQINRVRQGVTKGMSDAATRLKENFATLPPEQQQELFKKLPPNVQQMLKKQGGQ